ncbi:RNA polymerase sigma factor [Rathayibacter festucae]|uniref:RNA polymerase sigma factor n=1 Tax=Rathayibacter festucae TaxID=110937 RepID=UPI002A6B36FA|nr:sigma-70 family RNA polymerase sigma factor [Rathayibacter festucae]MDY0914499.1 sigma-70 family RNA polymerase sigma factor [Rathayibacter festucae]
MKRRHDGRAEELSEVLARERGDLLRYLERRLGHHDAADALADVMLTAWRRAHLLPREAEPARMWLFGIARNVLANSERSERRRITLADRLQRVLATAPVEVQPADDGAEVRDAIDRLAPEQAELVRLVHWDGFTIAAAGQLLGISASTTRTRYLRARTDLRAALTPPQAPPLPREQLTPDDITSARTGRP